MPPASLSTLAVMKPGPMTASSSTSRPFQCFGENFMNGARRLPRVSQHRDHVVCRDDAGKPLVLVHDGEGNEVVLVEQRRHFIVGGIGGACDGGFAHL